MACALSFAQSWSGYLVDWDCYARDQSNTNRYAGTVDREMSAVLKQCAPSAKTKALAEVLPGWDSLKLDSSGNAKAAELAAKSGKKLVQVTVTGARNHDSIKVSVTKTAQ
jgi:hypothetical protein